MHKSKHFNTVTTISKFNNFSPVRAKKIKKNNLLNYIPNKNLRKFTPLSCDRMFILIIVLNLLQSQELNF